MECVGIVAQASMLDVNSGGIAQVGGPEPTQWRSSRAARLGVPRELFGCVLRLCGRAGPWMRSQSRDQGCGECQRALLRSYERSPRPDTSMPRG